MTEEAAAVVDAPAGGAPAEPAADVWTAALPDNLRGVAEAKGWHKKPLAEVAPVMLDSYVNIERMRGIPAERLAEIPHDGSSDEVKAAWREKLGIPNEAAGYELGSVLGEKYKDDPLVAEFEGLFHEAGVSKAQAAALTKQFAETREKAIAQQDEAFTAAVDQHLEARRLEDPAAYNNMLAAVQQVGVSEEAWRDAVYGARPEAVIDLVAKLTAARTERPIEGVGDPDASLTMTPAAARHQAQALLGDPAFMQRYTSTNDQVREAAIAEMQRYQRIAGGVQ